MAEDPVVTVGLCARCVHARTIGTLHATYWLCRLSFTDPRFPKYPRLPVLSCPGFRPEPEVPIPPP